MRQPCVYLLASGKNGWIYVGVTSNLARRIYEHRSGLVPGWASEHGAVRLMRFEYYDSMERAIAREKALKKYPRKWKKRLIEQENPDWVDLYPFIIGEEKP